MTAHRPDHHDRAVERRTGHALPVLGDPDIAVSRRTFVCASALSLMGLALAGCGGGDATSPFGQGSNPPPAGSTTFLNGVVVITLGSVPDLTATSGHVVIAMTDAQSRRADLLVINAGGTYKAFGIICTHEGCTVTGFSGTRMQCPCHGSEYDLSGAPVAGPAPRALQQYAAVHDSTAGTLSIAVV